MVIGDKKEAIAKLKEIANKLEESIPDENFTCRLWFSDYGYSGAIDFGWLIRSKQREDEAEKKAINSLLDCFSVPKQREDIVKGFMSRIHKTIELPILNAPNGKTYKLTLSVSDCHKEEVEKSEE